LQPGKVNANVTNGGYRSNGMELSQPQNSGWRRVQFYWKILLVYWKTTLAKRPRIDSIR
jgi:hypothetical protein